MNKMKTCKACRTEIDARASVCPTKAVLTVICILVIGGYAIAHSGADNASPPPSVPKSASSAPEKKEPPPPPPTPAVGEDVSQEYFRYLEREVSFDCQQQIKALVKYDIRSPGTFYGTNSGDWAILRFDRWSKRVATDGTIRMAGDDAEAQNGLGNWDTCQLQLHGKRHI